MKKMILVSALVLVALIGVGTGAYLFYEYNDHKPLILECKVNQSVLDPVGRTYILKFEASRYGWSIGPDDGLGSAPDYWSVDEEQWISFDGSLSSVLKADKNRYEWQASFYQFMRIDRNSGDFFILACPSPLDALGRCTKDGLYEQDLIASEKGSCIKSAEPAKTLKQKF